MFDFINFLKTLSFDLLCTPEPREDIKFKNSVGEFYAPWYIFTWDDLCLQLSIAYCQVEVKREKTEEQIEKDLLEAETWMERSREEWMELLDIEDCHVEATHLSKQYVVEIHEVADLFRDAAAEVGAIVLDKEKCFDRNILITEEDWGKVVELVIKKLS